MVVNTANDTDLNGNRKDVVFSEFTWVTVILCSTVTVLLVSIYCLTHGINTIFMHLYYFPIVLLAYHYRYRGFVLASLLSVTYVGLVYFYDVGQSDIVTGAWYRFFVFIGIAIIIAYLAEKLNKEQVIIRKTSKKYQNLFENMLEGFAYCQMIYDPDGKPIDWIYLNVNPAFERLTGLKNIAGKRVLEAIPNIRELTPELFDTYGRVSSTGTPEIFEIDFLPLNLWLNVSVFSPEPGYFVAIFEDITARKKVEVALQGSEKRYRDLFEINNAVMLIIDPNTGRIVDANDAASRFYGYSREELRSLFITQINIADPGYVQEALIRTAGSRGTEFQFRHRKKSGEIRDVHVFSAPITLDGRVLLHSIIQDDTERKKLEEALLQTNKKLHLLSSITRHDILNQITALAGSLELAAESTDNPGQLQRLLGISRQATENIHKQIIFTKNYQDLGVQSPTWQPVTGCVANARNALPVGMIRIEDKTGTLEVYADPLFEKVFYNLIDNSLHYGGEKMTRIRILTRETGGTLRIIYEDDGNGISAEDKARLFSKGFGKHTGLGLFLSREILAITGITISENGEPGNGARFEIVVPKGVYRKHSPDSGPGS